MLVSTVGEVIINIAWVVWHFSMVYFSFQSFKFAIPLQCLKSCHNFSTYSKNEDFQVLSCIIDSLYDCVPKSTYMDTDTKPEIFTQVLVYFSIFIH